jgi:hypothetical protein
MNPNLGLRLSTGFLSLLLASCGGGGGGGASIVLDQENLLDGSLGGQGIGRFSDISGAPDPSGTSFDFQDAQTFTVGIAGRLAEIHVPVFNTSGGVLPVLLEIRNVIAGVPDFDDGTIVGAVSVPAADIPTSFTPSDPTTWVVFDVTGLGIDVDVGDQLAFVVRTPDSDGYIVNPESTSGYSGGAGFRRNRAVTTSWAGGSFDFGFRTFVRVP